MMALGAREKKKIDRPELRETKPPWSGGIYREGISRPRARRWRARVYRTQAIAYFSSRILPSSRSSWCSTKRRAHGTQLAEMRDELKAEREARGAAHVELRGGIDHRPRRTRWCRTGNATPMHQFRMRNVQPRPSAASHQPLEV